MCNTRIRSTKNDRNPNIHALGLARPCPALRLKEFSSQLGGPQLLSATDLPDTAKRCRLSSGGPKFLVPALDT